MRPARAPLRDNPEKEGMAHCLFVTDLHGKPERYEVLWEAVRAQRPGALFLGGDLLPHHARSSRAPADPPTSLETLIASPLRRLRTSMGGDYPRIFAILGNDDPRCHEQEVMQIESEGLWTYVHARRARWGRFLVMGYAFVPPTPFLLKDWERYDVSRFVDPGCISPAEGYRSVPLPEDETERATIAGDLDSLAGEEDLHDTILLFHSPPYGTVLDRAALDGRTIDAVPLDLHVGSIAIRRFIEEREPRIALHGHVHESTRLTGQWSLHLGETYAFNGAHDGPELAIVRFDPENPAGATRELIGPS